MANASAMIPGAIASGAYWFQGRVSAGAAQPRIDKVVLHSTETPGNGGCPGYAGGTMAPTLTINPWTLQSWQHFPANVSAKALADPGSTAVRENRDNVAQIEIIGYCSPALYSRYGFAIKDIPESGLAYIAAVLAFYHREWGLPLTSSVEWASYAALAPGRKSVRLSGPAFDAYSGVLGHQHVSGNDHLDPGDLNVTRILQLAGGSQTIPSVQKEDDMYDEAAEKRLMTQMAYIAGMLQSGERFQTAENRDFAKMAGQPYTYLKVIGNTVVELKAQIAALSSTIAALAKSNGSTLTVEQITSAAKAGADASLDERISDAVVNLNVSGASS